MKTTLLALLLFIVSTTSLEEGIDLSDMIQDTIGLAEQTQDKKDTNQRTKQQKQGPISEEAMSAPDEGMPSNNLFSGLPGMEGVPQDKKAEQEVNIEKTKMDMGELVVNKDKMEDQQNREINSDLKKLMTKFSENNNLMVLNQNIKIDTSHIDDLAAQIDKKAQQQADKNGDLRNLEERLHIESLDVNQLEQDVAAENEKLGRSEQKREDLEVQDEALQNSRRAVQNTLDTARKIKKKLKESLDKNDNQKDIIENENAQLQKEIGALRTEKEKIVELVESERRRGEESHQELQDSQDKYEQLSEQIRSIRKQHDDMVQELESLGDLNKQTGLQLLQAQDDQNQYQAQLTHKQEALKAVHLNLEFIKRMSTNIEQEHKTVDDQKRDQEDRTQTLDYSLKKLASEQEMQKNELVNKMEEYKIGLQRDKRKLQEEFEAELALETKQKERIDKLRSIDQKLSNQRVFLGR